MSSRSVPRARGSTRGGRPRAGQELTEEDIADAALAVIADGGVDSLTRAEVAGKLAVSVRALYRLAPSVDHLVAGAAGRWQQKWNPPPETGDWMQDLREWCLETKDHAAAYPGLTAAVQGLSPELVQDHTARVMSAVVSRLHRAGFDPDMAASLFGVLSMHSLGWALVFPVRRSDGGRRRANAPAADEKHLEFHQRGFVLGLDMLLEGIAGQLPL